MIYKLATALLVIPLLAACGGGEPATSGDARTVDTSAGTATEAGESIASLCTAHQVASSLCFICDPELREDGRMWCREHSRYEDRCWLCHPDLQDPDRLYCNEHGLYEDECFYCHPEILDSETDRSAVPERPGTELFCNEHGVPEMECGICQPARADGLVPGQGLKIRLLSEQAAAEAGITAEAVEPDSGAQTLTLLGELRFNQNRLARIAPQVEGVVRKVHVDLGDKTGTGAPLVEISSPRIAEAKAGFLNAAAEAATALQRFDRESTLNEQGISSGQELQEARASHIQARSQRRAAEQQLLDLGFTEEDLLEMLETGSADSRLILRSPFSGTITARDAVVGDVVSPDHHLVTVCDLETLWLDLAVPEAVVTRLQLGSPVVIHPSSLNREFDGEVIWISDALDPTTRLGRVRASLANLDRQLKAGMYVEARVFLGGSAGVQVDRDGVHRFGGHPFVFLELEPDLFEVRRVALGGEANDKVLVVAGLQPGDRLVVDQSYLVKSEFQKSRLGAGCVD